MSNNNSKSLDILDSYGISPIGLGSERNTAKLTGRPYGASYEYSLNPETWEPGSFAFEEGAFGLPILGTFHEKPQYEAERRSFIPNYNWLTGGSGYRGLNETSYDSEFPAITGGEALLAALHAMREYDPSYTEEQNKQMNMDRINQIYDEYNYGNANPEYYTGTIDYNKYVKPDTEIRNTGTSTKAIGNRKGANGYASDYLWPDGSWNKDLNLLKPRQQPTLESFKTALNNTVAPIDRKYIGSVLNKDAADFAASNLKKNFKTMPSVYPYSGTGRDGLGR